ncbi:MAG: hybrid sensor histidine kinase/response regulator [Carboxylicivirga sp.]|jgi:two-component system sensor histidine kinase/response regulator|nr:hybrid sensor histidine kinase/response regulator [Carboxylicivirga sp.]
METKPPNILIVDDNILNLQVTTEILQEHGYRIGLAQSGRDALKQIEIQLPDLILLDIMMPEMDGIEVCRQIRKNQQWSDIPIIFLTARNQTEDIVKAFEAGGADYVTKPFQKEELLARVKSQIDLYRSKIEIKALNATRDRLYSIIAHDIKTPFANIMFIVSAIKDKHIEPGTPDFDEIIDQLEKTSSQTNDLLNNLLTWTRYQSGSISPDFELVDLKTLVEETAQLMQATATQKRIQTKCCFADDCNVMADATSVKTIIRNLYSNAIKFSEPEKAVEISVLKENGYCKLMIADSGVGMDQQTQDRLFNKKESFTSYGTNQEAGTGLGLQIVRDFTLLNKAEMAYASEPGKGTSISIIFSNPTKL